MDFVSAHRGAIPAAGMSAEGQFTHPLVVRAKLEIAAACHGHAKLPSHGVVTEFHDARAIAAAASRASRELGYTRMWSIHPNQIEPIVAAFAPSAAEVEQAIEIISAAQDADWAPISHRKTLHDRASYRYFWCVLLVRARTGASHRSATACASASAFVFHGTGQCAGAQQSSVSIRVGRRCDELHNCASSSANPTP